MAIALFNIPMYVTDVFKQILEDKPDHKIKVSNDLIIEHPDCINIFLTSRQDSHTDSAEIYDYYDYKDIKGIESKRMILSRDKLICRDMLTETNYLIGMIETVSVCKKHPVYYVINELRRSKFIHAYITNEKIPEFPNVDYWFQVLVEYGDPIHSIIMEQTADESRGTIDFILNDNNTLFISLFNGLFMFTPLFRFRHSNDLVKYKEDLGKFLNAAIRATNQQRKSLSRSRLLTNIKNWNQVIKEMTNNTKWDIKLARLIHKLLIGDNKRKYTYFNEVRLDPKICNIIYDDYFSNQLSLIEVERRILRAVLELLSEALLSAYEKNIKRRKRNLDDRRKAVNCIDDNKKLILNDLGSRLINSPAVCSYAGILDGVHYM